MFAHNQLILWLVVIFVIAIIMIIYLSRQIDTKESVTSVVEDIQVKEPCSAPGVLSGIYFGFGFGIGISIAFVCFGVLFGGLIISTVGSFMSL